MFWTCSKLSNYWQSFFKSISEILGISVSLSPQIAIFGVPPDELVTTSMQDNVIAFASLIARRKILLLWKSSQPPSFKSWLHINGFMPSKMDSGFRKWSKYGLTNLHQLHDSGNFKSCAQLSEEFKLPNRIFSGIYS